MTGHAERHGWLECLVKSASETNKDHAILQTITAEVLAGIEAEGTGFYQPGMSGDWTETENEILYADLRPYLEWMQRRSSKLPLAPLDPSGRDSELIGLNDVFIALDVDKAGQDKLSDGSDAVYSAASGHLHEQKQLVLLGDPGSGKSTLLRYLALCLCSALLEPEGGWLEKLQWTVRPKNEEERNAFRLSDDEEKGEQRQWQASGLVPVYIHLRDFARHSYEAQDENAIWQYVSKQLAREGQQEAAAALEMLAAQNRLFFMFDGVDEVPPEERRRVWGAIDAFQDSPYGGNRWAATCRILSFVEEELPRRGLAVATLQKLDQEQIDHFIENWYRALQGKEEMTAAEAENKTSGLQDASRGYLHELAQNPMLLTIMAIVQTYEGTLPHERAMLYQRCVETMLLRWQRDKDKEDKETPSILAQLETSQAQLEQLLWRLGWEAHNQVRGQDRAADLPYWDVLKIASEQLGSAGKAELFLEYTEKKAHLLAGSGGKADRHYTFPHRTFQEYLAACYLESERRPLRRIADLAGEGDPWREVINLAFGRLMHVKNDRVKAIDIIVDRLLEDELPADEEGWRRLWLTGEACAVIGQEALLEDEEGAAILPRMREQLVALLENEALTPRQRAEAGDALGALGDPRPGVCTLEPELIAIPGGEFIYQDGTHTIEQPFAVARYPVTVAQFAMFVEDGGYEEARYWGGEEGAGRRWRQSDYPNYRGDGPITQPWFWLQPRWHGANRPVVGVSWYEATAYCTWLTEKSGRTYRLPSEEEWERAARHTDGREWAWGNEWEDGIINSREARINRTSSVGAFPRGAAVCGADDLCGNVWEWTASFYDKDRDSYVVRGGSWVSNPDSARVASRLRYFPNGSFNYFGFRVVAPVF